MPRFVVGRKVRKTRDNKLGKTWLVAIEAPTKGEAIVRARELHGDVPFAELLVELEPTSDEARL